MNNSKDRKDQTKENVKNKASRSLPKRGEDEIDLNKAILDILNRNAFRYLIIDEEKRIRVPYHSQSNRLWLDILHKNEAISFRVIFPFKISILAVPLLEVFITDFNQYRKEEKLNLNFDEGAVRLDYYYGAREVYQLDEEDFLFCLRQVFEHAKQLYDVLWRISELELKGRTGEYYREWMYSLLTGKNEELKKIKTEDVNKDKYINIEKTKDLNYFSIGNYIGISKVLAVDQSAKGSTFLIETVLLEEKEGLEVTGLAGDMIVESVKVAVTIIKKMFPGLLSGKFIHVHMGEGSVAKDGTSAGVSILMSILSAAIGIPIYDKEPFDIAFTGELRLNGHIVEVGNVEEKISAAIKSGCKKVFIPEKDFKRMNVKILENPRCEVIPVNHVYSIIKQIFTEKINIEEVQGEKKKIIVNHTEN